MRKRIADDSSSNYPVEVMTLTVEEQKQVVRFNKANQAFVRTYGLPMETFNKRTVHRFLLRYFPKTEEELDDFLIFLKAKRRSSRRRYRVLLWKRGLRDLAKDFFSDWNSPNEKLAIVNALKIKAASEETAYIDNTLN